MVQTQRRQDDLSYFLTEMLRSTGGNCRGVCSPPHKHLRQREIDNQLPPKTNLGIRDGMVKTKGLAKAVPKDIT